MQNNPTYRFLGAIRERTIIVVVPGPEVQDEIVDIIETAALPCQDEFLSISLGRQDYEVDYGKWCRKEITIQQATLIIDFLREKVDQIKIYDDPFQLLTPEASIRNYINEWES